MMGSRRRVQCRIQETKALRRIPSRQIWQHPIAQACRFTEVRFIQRGQRLARVIDVRDAVGIKQPTHLEKVAHDALIVRLAIWLERSSSMPEGEVVSKLVHQSGALYEVSAHEVIPATERDHDVAAQQVGNSRIAPGCAVTDRKSPVVVSHSCAGRSRY